MKEDCKRLHDEIEQLKNEKALTEYEKTCLEQSRDEMLKRHDMTEEGLKWYTEAKAELRKYGLCRR